MTRASDPGGEAAWTTAHLSAYPERPYPGDRPTGSWRLTPAGQLHALDQLDGDPVRDLATGERLSLAGRDLVLAYGSNANPQKLLSHFAGEDIFALEAEVEEWAAAWCSTRRTRDDVVVCTLVPAAGTRERHPVLAVTPAQRNEMDEFEGHPHFYLRAPFTGRLALNDGSSPSVEVYLGTPDRRPALQIDDGLPLRCSEVSYAEADQLVRNHT